MMTIWVGKSQQGDGSRVFEDQLYKHRVREGGQMIIYSDNFMDDYHICSLIVYMRHVTLLTWL